MSLLSFLETLVHVSTDEERVQLLYRLLETIVATPHSFAAVRAEKAFWHPAVMHARAVMSDCKDEAVNIHDIADEVGLNMRYFISLFKDGTGLPPHQYQIAMRVERARGLIQKPNSSLCDVAAYAGFSDQSHLSRQFKRSYGYTPGAFRQNLKTI